MSQEGPSSVERSRKQRVKVVVVGGGCAGLAAAWQLAKTGEYEIHVYEKSLRLGGKGESVRDEQGRILEHGLHVWLGFYENAFRMMRECYAEVEARGWGPGPGSERKLVHRTLWDAFLPEPNIGVGGDQGGRWTLWTGLLPPERGLPGDDLDPDTNPFTLASYLRRGVNLVRALMQSMVAPPGEESPGEPRPDGRSRVDEMLDLEFSSGAAPPPAVLLERIAQLLRAGVLTTAAGVLQAVTTLERILQQLDFAPQSPDTVLAIMEAILAQLRKQLRDFVSIDPRLRWKTEIIDIVMTIAVGLYRDRVLLDEHGLDALNHFDYRDWLLKHGATKTSVESPFIRGIYDLVFAYRGGDRERPGLAAGVALRGALRMFFTYRGAMFWRLRSGMGEAVFAPLYRVLLLPDRKAARAGEALAPSPVTFHLGHELARVRFDREPDGRRYVSQLEFVTQGPAADLDAYSADALDACGCWRGDRTFGERRGTVRLDVGEGERGFDAVVFAMGIEDFARACGADRTGEADGDPLFRDVRWERMRNSVATVATKSAQVWLRRDIEQLGWYRGSGLVTALGLEYDTWADMTHTLAAERDWRASHGVQVTDEPRSVAYFCGVLADAEIDGVLRAERDRAGGDAPAEEAAVARRCLGPDLDLLLGRSIAPLWPGVLDRDPGAGPLELKRHTRANLKGSERYTLSLPNTIHLRISPLDRSVSNMTIAGDWTACGLDAGCVEAAVMSGMLAAHAISGRPALHEIVGYDHP